MCSLYCITLAGVGMAYPPSALPPLLHDTPPAEIKTHFSLIGEMETCLEVNEAEALLNVTKSTRGNTHESPVMSHLCNELWVISVFCRRLALMLNHCWPRLPLGRKLALSHRP